MFGKRGLPRMDKVDTIVGKETEFRGTIRSQGVLRIDGRIEGEVHNNGDIIVGESGVVTANMRARHVAVAGEVKGNIDAEGRLELVSTARVYGDIKMAQFVVADGAVFQGTSSMRGQEEASTYKREAPAQPHRAHDQQ